MRDARDGAAVFVEPCNDGFRFVAKDVPPLGYATFAAAEGATVPPVRDALRADAETGVLENAWYRIEADAGRGCIRSFLDKATNRQLAEDCGWGFGQYLYERFSKKEVDEYVKAYAKLDTDWARADFGKPNLPPAEEAPYISRAAHNARASARVSPVSATLEWRFSSTPTLPHEVTMRYTLYAELPVLDVSWTIHGKPAEVWPEAGWLCFPCDVPKPRFHAYRLGGVADAALDFRKGANRDVTCLYGGAAVYSLGREQTGLGLCPLDSPLVSFDRPGLWKYSPDFTPERPRIYVNLYNNQWSTNFQLWSEGTWTSRVRLWAISGYSEGASLAEPSLEARYPLLAGEGAGTPGKLPVSQPGLTISRPGVLVTALAEQKDGLLLRLWEQSWRSGTRRGLPPAGRSLQPGRSVRPARHAQ